MSDSTKQSINTCVISKTNADHWVICDSKSYPGLKFYVNKLTGIKVWNITDSEIALAEKADKGGAEPYGRPMNPPIDTRIYNKQIINNQFSNQLSHLIMNTAPAISHNPFQVWEIPQNRALPLQQQCFTIVPTSLVPFINQLDAAKVSQTFQQNILPNTSMQRPEYPLQYAQNKTPHKTNNKKANYKRNKWLRQQNMTPQNQFTHTNNSPDLRKKLVRRKSFSDTCDGNEVNELSRRESNTWSNYNTRNDQDRDESSVQMNLSPLKALTSSRSDSDQWYIVVDMDVILKNYTYLNDMATADPDCHLLVPHHVMSELRDHVSKSSDVQARRILRFLTQQIESGLAMIGEEVPGDNISLMTMQTCSNLASQNNHVILIASEQNIFSYTISSNVHVFTMQEIKNILTKRPIKPRPLSPTYAVKIIVPNTIREGMTTRENTILENQSQSSLDSTRSSDMHCHNENTLVFPSANYAMTDNDNSSVFDSQGSYNTSRLSLIHKRAVEYTSVNNTDTLSEQNIERMFCEDRISESNAQSSFETREFSEDHIHMDTENKHLSNPNVDYSRQDTQLSNNHAHKRALKFSTVTNSNTDNAMSMSSEDRFSESKNQRSFESTEIPKKSMRITLGVPSLNDSETENMQLSKPNVHYSRQLVYPSIDNVPLGIVDNSKTGHPSPPKAVSKERSAVDTHARVNTLTNTINDIDNQLSTNQIASVGDVGPKNPNSLADPTGRSAVVKSASRDQPVTTISSNRNLPNIPDFDYSPSKSSSTTTSLDTVHMKKIISMKRLTNPRIPLPRRQEFTDTHNKPASRDASYDSASETSVRNEIYSENVIVEETSTSAISNSSYSSKGTCASKADKKKTLRTVLMYPIACQSMEDVLKTRCEEWVFTFVHIMEEVLRVKLQEKMPHENTEYPAPRNLLEAASSILKKYSDCHYFNVVDAAFKLLSVLHKTSDENGKIVNIQPTEYMEMYSYGLFLVETFLDMSENCQEPSCKKSKTLQKRDEKEKCSCFEVSAASDSLKKLLYNIQNANLDTFADIPPDHGLDNTNLGCGIPYYEDDARDEVDIPTQDFGHRQNYEYEDMPLDNSRRYEQEILNGDDNQRYEERSLSFDDNQHLERDVMFGDSNRHYERDEMLSDGNAHYEGDEIHRYEDNILNEDDGLNYEQGVHGDDNQRYAESVLNDDVGLGYELHDTEHGDDSISYDQNTFNYDNTSYQQDKIQRDENQSFEQNETQSTNNVYNLRSRQSQKTLTADSGNVSPQASSASQSSKLSFFDSLQLKKTFGTSTPVVTRDTKNVDQQNADKQNAYNQNAYKQNANKQNYHNTKVLSPVKRNVPEISPNKLAKDPDNLKNLKIHFAKEDLNYTSNTKLKVIRNFTVNADFERKMKEKRLEKKYAQYIGQKISNETQCADMNEEKANEKLIKFTKRLMQRVGDIITRVNLLCKEYVKEEEEEDVTSKKTRDSSTKSELRTKMEEASHLIENIHNLLESISKRELQDNIKIQMLLKIANVGSYTPDNKLCLEYCPSIAMCQEATKVIHEKLQAVLKEP